MSHSVDFGLQKLLITGNYFTFIWEIVFDRFVSVIATMKTPDPNIELW